MSIQVELNVWEKALNILDERGWHQGGWGSKGGVCILGALGLASSGAITDLTRVDLNRLAAALSRRTHGRCEQAAMWNDEPGRTVEDVRSLLKDLAIEEVMSG